MDSMGHRWLYRCFLKKKHVKKNERPGSWTQAFNTILSFAHDCLPHTHSQLVSKIDKWYLLPIQGYNIQWHQEFVIRVAIHTKGSVNNLLRCNLPPGSAARCRGRRCDRDGNPPGCRHSYWALATPGSWSFANPLGCLNTIVGKDEHPKKYKTSLPEPQTKIGKSGMLFFAFWLKYKGKLVDYSPKKAISGGNNLHQTKNAEGTVLDMAGWFGISFLHVSLAKPFYACWVITGMVRADDVDTCLRCLAQILPFIYVKVCLPINTASGEISFFGWKIESTHGSWKLRFVSFVARHGHKQIAASILRNINGWEWMVEGTSTLNRKSQNQDQLQPSKPSNPSKLHSSPLSPFPFPLTPPPKKTKLLFSCFAKKSQDSTKMEVAKDAFKTCSTGAICSGKPAATPMVQPLERTPPGTEAWIWKRYSESVNKSSNLGGNFGGLVGQVGWDLVVRWFG